MIPKHITNLYQASAKYKKSIIARFKIKYAINNLY